MLNSKKNKEINLIPESEQVASLSQSLPILVLLGLAIVGTLVLAVSLFFLKSSAELKTKELEENLAIKNQEWQQVASSAAEIGSIKNKLTAYQNFKTNYPPVETYVENLKNSLPSSVIISSLDVDNLGKASVQFKSQSAVDAYQLAEELKRNTKLSNVNLVSIVKAAEKNEYTINFTLNISK